MKNHVVVAGYAAFGFGLFVTASLVSPGFTPDALPVAIAVGLGAFGVSLVCMTISGMWSRWQMAPAVARRQSDPETPAGPRGNA